MACRYSLTVTVAVLCTTTCASPEPTSQFDGICRLYENALQQDVSITEKWGIVIEQMESSYPQFYQDNYVYIMDMDPSQRYDVYKRLEKELEGSGSWECSAMKAFFSELESS